MKQEAMHNNCGATAHVDAAAKVTVGVFSVRMRKNDLQKSIRAAARIAAKQATSANKAAASVLQQVQAILQKANRLKINKNKLRQPTLRLQ